LRRLKKDVEKQLPSKTEVIIRCPLSRRQKYLYDEFINKNETKNKIQNQEFLSLMNVVMQLRKVCNHPDLFEPRAIESGFLTNGLTLDIPTLCILHYYNKMNNIHNLEGFNLFQYEEEVGSQFIYENRIKYLPFIEEMQEIQQNNLDEVESYSSHFSYKWRKIKCDFRNENIERSFNRNVHKVSLQKPIYGKHVIQYIQKCVNIQHKEEVMKSYHLIKSVENRVFDLKDWLDNYMVCYNKVISTAPSNNPSKYCLEYEKIQETFETNMKESLQLVANTFHYSHVRLQLLFPDKKFLIYDCGKLNTMMQLLVKLKSEKHKVLIFTQMTKMLDIFEFSLNVFQMTYVRLDGGTRVNCFIFA